MRKPLVAFMLASSAFALTAASAATLTISSYLPQAGTVSAACDTDGVLVTWTEVSSAVTQAVVTNIAEACIGNPITVTASGSSVTYANTAAVSVSDGTTDVNSTTIALTATGTAGPRTQLTTYTVTIN